MSETKTYTGSAKGIKYAMTVQEATTPTGKPGVRITCTCPTHGAKGGAAIIATTSGLSFDRKLIHGNVTMANAPMGALAARQGKAWKA